jgi:predicted HAD superfamily Cof-like phosphohydrolase
MAATGDPQCPNCGLYITPSDNPHECFKATEGTGEAEAIYAHLVLDDLGVPDEELTLAERIQALHATSTIRSQVEAFCRAAGHPVLDHPQVPSHDRVKLRVELVMEEFFELLQAVYPQFKEVNQGSALFRVRETAKYMTPRVDLPAMADALADLDYVVEGARLEFGIDGGPIAEEVQRANMSKFGPGSWKREDGKQMKPPDWTPPDIEGVLQAQGWTEPKPPEPTPIRYPDIVCDRCGEVNCTKAHVR